MRNKDELLIMLDMMYEDDAKRARQHEGEKNYDEMCYYEGRMTALREIIRWLERPQGGHR